MFSRILDEAHPSSFSMSSLQQAAAQAQATVRAAKEAAEQRVQSLDAGALRDVAEQAKQAVSALEENILENILFPGDELPPPRSPPAAPPAVAARVDPPPPSCGACERSVALCGAPLPIGTPLTVRRASSINASSSTQHAMPQDATRCQPQRAEPAPSSSACGADHGRGCRVDVDAPPQDEGPLDLESLRCSPPPEPPPEEVVRWLSDAELSGLADAPGGEDEATGGGSGSEAGEDEAAEVVEGSEGTDEWELVDDPLAWVAPTPARRGGPAVPLVDTPLGARRRAAPAVGPCAAARVRGLTHRGCGRTQARTLATASRSRTSTR